MSDFDDIISSLRFLIDSYQFLINNFNFHTELLESIVDRLESCFSEEIE